jgi:hypothetical protein
VVTNPLVGRLGLGRDDDGNVTMVTMPGLEAHDLSYTPVGLLEAYTPPVVLGAQAPQSKIKPRERRGARGALL